MTRTDKTYRTIEVSVETDELLCSLQDLLQRIFGKKKISKDKLILWLLKTKVDWVDLIASKDINEPQKPLS